MFCWTNIYKIERFYELRPEFLASQKVNKWAITALIPTWQWFTEVGQWIPLPDEMWILQGPVVPAIPPGFLNIEAKSPLYWKLDMPVREKPEFFTHLPHLGPVDIWKFANSWQTGTQKAYACPAPSWSQVGWEDSACACGQEFGICLKPQIWKFLEAKRACGTKPEVLTPSLRESLRQQPR